MTNEKATTKPPCLAMKLCMIMGELTPVEKGGTNTMQNYSYVKESDVSEAIRKLLAKHKVICLPSTESISEREYTTAKGGIMNMVQVKVKYTFINAEDPNDKYETFHYGNAADSGDKAIWKSLTGCQKYMQMKTFFMGSEDDPEKDHADRSGASKPVQGSQPRMQNGPTPTGGYLYQVPFTEKDKWKPILVRNGFKWDAAAKAWRGNCVIVEMPADYLKASPLAEDDVDEMPLEGYNL